MQEKNHKPYSQIAEIYAHLMNLIDYPQWAYYYYILSKDYIESDAKVLEIASGNCKLANSLLHYYKNITASDLSFEMLKKSVNENLPRVCCDMRNLPFKQKFNLIFSAFDSVNYLLSLEDIEKFFRQVYEILDENGVFTFDLSLERNSIKNIKLLNRKGIYKGIKYKQESFYDQKEKLHHNNFLIKLPDGNFVNENHVQKIYEIEEIIFALVENGFYVVNCFDAFSSDDIDERSERAQIVAKKIVKK